MLKFQFKSVCKAFTAFFCLVSLNAAWGEDAPRSFWQRFAHFFTPSGSFNGEGPVFDELKSVESQIDKLEVQYSRERRPGNKTRYRKQLDSLRNVRDSLITVIEKMPTSSAVVASSSSAISSAVLSSSFSADTVAPTPAIVAAPVSLNNAACVHDTVFVHDTLVVRDTVVIHDTLYVVLANKPGTAPKEKKKGAAAPAK